MASKTFGFGGLSLGLEVEVGACRDEEDKGSPLTAKEGDKGPSLTAKEEDKGPSRTAKEGDKGPGLAAMEEGKEDNKVGGKLLALSSR